MNPLLTGEVGITTGYGILLGDTGADATNELALDGDAGTKGLGVGDAEGLDGEVGPPVLRRLPRELTHEGLVGSGV